MSWSNIKRLGTAYKGKCPDNGVLVAWRPVGRSGGGYISLRIGAGLAARLGLADDTHPVRIMLGSDNDAGKMAIALDKGGDFIAKGKAGRGYGIPIPKATAESFGFSCKFPPFERDHLEVIKPENGQPRFFAFLLTGAFLSATTSGGNLG